MYREAEHIIATLGRDWAAVFGGNNHDHHTGENTISRYVHCLILPEARPDRFEHTVWFSEFFILVDGRLYSSYRVESFARISSENTENLTREMVSVIAHNF